MLIVRCNSEFESKNRDSFARRAVPLSLLIRADELLE